MKKILYFLCIVNIIFISCILFISIIGIFALPNDPGAHLFFIAFSIFLLIALSLIIFFLRKLKKTNDSNKIKNRRILTKADKNILRYTGVKDINIDYVDASGVFTNRDITIKYIYKENDILYIRAFCYLRNEERTFKVLNINKIYINGAEIDEPELYFKEKTNNSELSDK